MWAKRVEIWGPVLYGAGFWLYLLAAIGPSDDWLRTLINAFCWPVVVPTLLLTRVF
jgi:hypothetical protein